VDYDTFFSARKGGLGEDMAKVFNLIRDKYAKACNFLIAYLGGYTTLAGNLLIPNELAKELMESTFLLYPRLKPWQNEMIEFAKTYGYTQTAYGTRRHAEADLWSSDAYLSKRQERQLVNAIIQGGAADILKVIRQEISRRKMRERYMMKAVRPVYDEITASVPIDRALDYSQELVEVMSVIPPGYPVGMLVEVSIGRTWGDQKEAKGTSIEAIQAVLDGLVGQEITP
jgi:DNA polymerase-1